MKTEQTTLPALMASQQTLRQIGREIADNADLQACRRRQPAGAEQARLEAARALRHAGLI